MNPIRPIESLARTGPIICSLVSGLDESQWRFKPPTGNWSVLEIVCHLADEEVDDFRTRLKLTLESPELPWPQFGPIPAGDLLNAWAAHDLLHIRQITKRLFELNALEAKPFENRYAGNWVET